MVNPENPKYAEAFSRLLRIMNELREQCPWDKKQTLDSLRYLTIEETYELSDAIIEKDMEEIKKELGDILLHLVFYAKIADEKEAFDIADVIHAVCEKLIKRHPHIYGDVKAESEEEVKQNWEKIKLQEKGKSGFRSVLEGVPKSLPSLVKAIRIQEKARGVGFDWDNKSDVWEKVKEEISEFEELNSNNITDTEEKEAEFGDLLFSLINYARFEKLNPETALERTNKKFIKRFRYIEEQAGIQGKAIDELSLVEMDELWNEAKTKTL